MIRKSKSFISVSNLTIGYDDHAILKNLSFDVARGDIFVIMGPSGCGKSTLLRAMTGLITPLSGHITVDGIDFATQMHDIMRRVGVLFQGGALFSSMTVGENIELPLRQYTNWDSKKISDTVNEKLSLVDMTHARDLYPSELSGGMRKRAGLARALALNPEILYLDEPSAGLDPISSHLLDNLILDINRNMGTTIILVSHELESIFAVGTNSIFLSPSCRCITGRGKPDDLRANPPTDQIKMFLTRGNTK